MLDSDIKKKYDPTSKQFNTTMEKLQRRFRLSKKNPTKEKYLVFFLFATHGYLRDGVQFILLNGFDKKDNYY